MCKRYYSNEDGLNAYEWMPKHTLEDIKKQIRNSTSKQACLLIDETNVKVLDNYRTHFVFGKTVADMQQLHRSIVHPFYRLQFRCYGRAVHEILKDDKNAPDVTLPRYEIVVPMITIEPGNKRKIVLVRQVTTPLYLDRPDEPRVFASINTYEVVGEYFGDLFYVNPRITENGLPLQLQTDQLKRIGNQYISTYLPFTSRELDVLELLADNNSIPDICRLLGQEINGVKVPMATGTLIKHRSRISAKAKELFSVDMDSKKAALTLRKLRLI